LDGGFGSLSESVQNLARSQVQTVGIVFVKTASVRLPANLDIEDVDEVKAVLGAAEWADEAVVDFSELPAISATVLGALVSLMNRMVEHNRLGVIRIVGANAATLRILQLCRADTLFDLSGARRAAFPKVERVYAN
jgi:anti-anti-sigma regulatory factor